MSTELNRILYSDLGETWLRDHKARILQRHLQFGRHFRIDVDSLLSRAALLSRSRINVSRQVWREDFMRRATIDAIDAIEHCLRLEAETSAAIPQPIVA